MPFCTLLSDTGLVGAKLIYFSFIFSLKQRLCSGNGVTQPSHAIIIASKYFILSIVVLCSEIVLFSKRINAVVVYNQMPSPSPNLQHIFCIQRLGVIQSSRAISSVTVGMSLQTIKKDFSTKDALFLNTFLMLMHILFIIKLFFLIYNA